MTRGFRVGSFLGFEIRIDRSWFVIFFLILWTFTAGAFPAARPGLSMVTYFLMGLAGTVLFFASLLAHELSHSIVARRRGIEVKGITLFLFGGVAHTHSEATTPGDEFTIAAVGPFVSFVIAGVLLLLSVVIGDDASAGAVTAVLQHIGVLNAALAIFNLLPGFPLDGGRVLRAAVWKSTGDLHKATRWASNGGIWLGYALAVAGLFQILGGALVGGMWLILIGWFIRSLARASYSQYVLHESLDGATVEQVMTHEPQSIAPHTTIALLVDNSVQQGRHRAYPVTDDGRLIGLITLDRVRQVPRETWDSVSVSEVMSPVDASIIAGPDEAVTDIVGRLGTAGRLLVTRNGQLVGVLTTDDLSRWIEQADLRRRSG